MRRIVILALLPLAACGTPREACISRATKDLRVVDRLIVASQTNLDRGYAIGTQSYITHERELCGKSKGKNIYCSVPVTAQRKVPVAINLNDEQAKLDSLIEKREQLELRTSATISQCRISHQEA